MHRPPFKAELYFNNKTRTEYYIGYRKYRLDSNDITLSFVERHVDSMNDLRAEDIVVSGSRVFSGGKPTMIPSYVEDCRKGIIGVKINEGFKHIGSFMVNPFKGEITPIDPHLHKPREDTESKESESLSWMVLPPSLNEDDKYLLRQILFETFAFGADQFGFGMSGHCESGGLPSSLMDTGSFQLSVKSRTGENSIDPNLLEGAGELRFEHGHRPLLMILYLQKRLKESLPSTGESVVQLADSNGAEITFDRFSKLQPMIEAMGFDFCEVRNDAIKLGLAEEIIDLSSISVPEENFYF